MSLLALLFILVAFFAIGLIVARGVRRPAAPTDIDEPTCAKCGYIVRGIEGLICPECGSDLREVGIVAPGLRKPLGAAARLAIWTAMATPPALVLGAIAASYLAPWNVTATRQRTIFLQSQSINHSIHVQQRGHERVIGRPRHDHPVPLRVMSLSVSSSLIPTVQMDVDLPTSAAQFTDASGKTVTGKLDAPFIAVWLNANGVIDPTVPQRAVDVLAALDDMTSDGGGGFRNFSPNPARGNLPNVVAHPASKAFVVPTPAAITPYVPYALAAILWASGLPFVLRRRGGTRRVARPRVESRADADQA